MTEPRDSYSQIMKATSLFGGVQIFKIIIQIIKSKFIAILLGPAGMGIMGMLISSTAIIGSFTNFGLSVSAVKDISSANSLENENRISTIISVFKRLIWVTGLLGTLVTLVLSSWLSELSFGNRDYTIAFMWISITLLINQLSNGQLVVLQGLRKLKYMAQANLLGSASSLLVTLPLYYYYGIDGIVPGMIGTAISTLLFAKYFSNKVIIVHIPVTSKQTIKEGRGMLKMGFMISLSGLLSVGASYIVRIFINRIGGIEQVGLYNAGFAIINTYVGLVFAAMATDYYPRLSSTADNNIKSKKTINEQAEVAILILSPLIIFFLVFIKRIVIILYSNEFIAVDGMLHWAVLGIFFKAASWSIGFILLAKGASSLFIYNELIANLYILSLNLLGYFFLGLTGLGISFIVGFFLYLIQIYFFTRIKYNFDFGFPFIRIFLIQFLLAISCFVVVKNISSSYSFIIGVILIFISTWYSYNELDKRMGLKNLILKYRNKL